MAQHSFTFQNADFDGVKDDLKAFMKTQTRFKDYDFEGSNLSVLLDVMSYNTFKNMYYYNMVGTEMWQDTAQLRQSVVSHAKELNYLPHSKTSARALVTFEFFPAGTPDLITIPKYYAVQTSVQGKTVKFLTNQTIVVPNQFGRYVSEPVEVFEGELVTEYFEITSNDNGSGSVEYASPIILQSENIDTSSLEISVKASLNDNMEQVYERRDTLYQLNNKSLIYFLRGYRAYQYEVEMGDGVFGKSLSTGNIVIARYRDTVGAEVNGAYMFNKTSNIDNVSSIDITTIEPANSGASAETTASIQRNSTKHFQRQGRTITPGDYEGFILENFPEAQAVIAYGGEQVRQYGKVFISIKPHGFKGLLTESLKKRIMNTLNLRNMTAEPVIVDPDYFHLNITGNVYYNPDRLLTNANQVKSDIINTLYSLNETMFYNFNIDVKQSVISTMVDNANSAITSSDLSFRLVKKWSPVLNSRRSIKFSFDNPLAADPTLYLFNNTQMPIVWTSEFTIRYDDVVTTVFAADDGLGALHLYSYNTAGVRFQVEKNVGTVNYKTGEVFLQTTVQGFLAPISIIARTSGRNLEILRQKFVVIEANDININLVQNTK
jgi:hypothetical protein